jgi:AcrR family transcriptional regulator
VSGNTDDGRRVRRDRNRDSVVEAMVDLFDEGNYAPSADEISERAGLSARSLFRYFDDIDDLCRSAIGHQLDRLRPTLPIEANRDAPLPDRIAAFVEQRLHMFEVAGSVGLVARLRAPFQPLIAAELTQARSFLRHQIVRLFGAELESMTPEVAARVIGALDVMTSFEAHQLLRQDQQLSREDAGAVLVAAVDRLLAPPAPERPA